MSRGQSSHGAPRAAEPRRPAGSPRLAWGPILAVVALAVVAVGALIWLGQARPEPAGLAVATSGKVIGNSSAPVEVEEWGDFQ